MAVTKTTRLQAINTLLETIGLSPVNTLSGQKTADIIRAESVLDEVSREVQLMGWHFNSEEDYLFTRDRTGQIPVPENILRLDYKRNELYDVDPVIRGSRLYDKANHTYQFDRDIKADVAVALEFDDLPESARRYITVRSARIFADRMVGEQTLNAFTSADEERAWVVLRQWEGETADYSIFDSRDMSEYKLRGRYVPRGI